MDNDKKKRKHFITVGEASILTGLDIQTIRKMADKASIICYRTPSGQRRIDLQSVQKLCSCSNVDKEKSEIQKKNYVYARVSTKKQVDDLSRQVEYLRKPEFIDYDVIKDIGSGINFKRKGLSTILDACLQRNIGEIVIAHRDRLCRFGYELIDSLVTKSGGKITVLEHSDNKTCEQELTEDLLSIIHVFSCRQMGKRSYSNRKNKNIENKDLPDRKTESNT